MHVIAHRGASAYAPEHTFEAYDLALAQGADGLELDVRALPGGTLVVSHDPPGPGDRPLALGAVLDRYGGEARLLVEVKELVGAAVALELERRRLLDTAEVMAFDRRALRAARRAVPRVALCALHERTTPASWVLRELPLLQGEVQAIGPWHGVVDPGLVAAAHAHALSVAPWTANAPADVRRLAAAGADAVITDVPDVARLVGAVAAA